MSVAITASIKLVSFQHSLSIPAAITLSAYKLTPLILSKFYIHIPIFSGNYYLLTYLLN